MQMNVAHNRATGIYVSGYLTTWVRQPTGLWHPDMLPWP